jgi:hypothetical protein
MTINSVNNTASSFTAGGLNLSTNVLSSTATNGNIVLTPNGTGLVSIAAAYTLPRTDGTAGFVLKTDGAGAVTFQAETSQPFAWSVVTATTQAITENNGYISNAASQITYTLPATAAVGDTFEVCTINAAGFKIDQGAGQTIRVGSAISSTGIAGSITSSGEGDWVKVVALSSTQFIATVQQGNVTVA